MSNSSYVNDQNYVTWMISFSVITEAKNKSIATDNNIFL